MAPLPLTLYVHLPWCVRKCPYCDFNSHALIGDLPEHTYIPSLLADLDAEAARAEGRPVHAIFFGGGTPSLFSAQAIGAVLDRAASQLALTEDCEVTLEANPGASEFGRFAGYHTAGVNRLSLGIQSFDNAMLTALGRIHDSAEAGQAIDAAARAGFARINLDLMHGLPGQTPAGAAADLDRALAYDTGHQSWYQLTLEPNTAFHHSPPALPDDDSLARIQDAGTERLAAAGYAQYEVSAWARPGEESRHNLNYWRFGDYLGVGAGAHGKLTGVDGRVVRRWKLRHPRAWANPAAPKIDGEQRLDAQTLRFEFMLNALRLREGFEESLFHERTGLEILSDETPWREARTRGLLECVDRRWRATELGWRFLDDLQTLFLPHPTQGNTLI
ncbi:MAG: radical SAM family heme chaperone HemW [Gammaproteobacteria bacterium]